MHVLPGVHEKTNTAQGTDCVTLSQFISPPQGPYFAPPYEPLPPDVRFIYNGSPMDLSLKAEEAAGFFAKMLDHEYTTKDVFCQNFFQDWRKVCDWETSSWF